jgi:hypothetical protein
MFRTRDITSWRPLRRRLIAAITLVAYLLATLGVPLPAAARKPEDQPFPCQDHPCGCRTAEQCWTACCCFTPEQRWAWARERHIQPPAYAERPAAQGWRTTRLRDREQRPPQPETSCRQCAAEDPGRAKGPAAKKSCCTGERSRPPCCEPPRPRPHVKPAPAQTCQTAPDCPECQTTPGQPSREAKAARKGSVRWGLGLSALRCQGQSTLWATTGAALPPAPPLTWSPCLPTVGWLIPSAESPLSLPSAPLEPPPRSPSA